MKLAATTKIYSITELNKNVKSLLEGQFNNLWISGEISNLAKPSSGHLYFSLKDNKAQIRCALFRGYQNQQLPLSNGQLVLAQAKISLYEARGDYQLIITAVHPAGDGALQIKFEQLKKKLAQEGLFDPLNKKSLPKIPGQIGIISSSSAAALQDILKVLKRRCPLIPVVIYPSLVQGDKAGAKIAQQIELANDRNECDVLIVARGGGSLEDLWPFNEELVARTIHASRLPIITGIGHETDFTIADLVADQRAPTPSAAAEQATPDQREWFIKLEQQSKYLQQLMAGNLSQLNLTVNQLQKRLRHPQQLIQQQMQQTDQLEKRLELAITNLLTKNKNRLCQQVNQLNTLNPLNTLSRGYAIASCDNKVIDTIDHVKIQQLISVKVIDGALNCRVEEITPTESIKD